ncbi:MAG TPA: hypothetical protein VFH88_13955 [Candidatus Krumholzibacteria bacterium]|nr:hypothetical protein [Candidatus Krumholzibacteria bacterium]
MRKRLAMIGLGLVLLACQREHPVNVFVDPRFSKTNASGHKVVEKIAVMDCASSLAQADDPDNLAPQIMGKYLVNELQTRTDYKFIATTTIEYTIQKTSSMDAYNKFLRDYAGTDKPDMTFLTPLAKELQCDAFLIPVVDLWQKDELDARETGTPATYVGATITIVSATDGSVLFRCTDEDYLEGASSEAADRQMVTSGTGVIRADMGAKTHRAPPFEDVAAKVAASLVSGLPAR